MPTVFVDSRPPSPMLRSPQRPAASRAAPVPPVNTDQVSQSASAQPSARGSVNASSRASPLHQVPQQSGFPQGADPKQFPAFFAGGFGYPGFPYQMPGYVPVPWPPPSQQMEPAAGNREAKTDREPRNAAASPARREAFEELDVELTSRLESKSKEIDALTKQNQALRAALAQTKENFEANVTQLKECQLQCRRLEDDIAGRDAKVAELEAYRTETAERVDHVDELLRREREHGQRVADDLKRHLDAVHAERANLESRIVSLQEEVDRARQEYQSLKRQFQREVSVAAHNSKAEVESENDERLRAARAKIDEREGTIRQMENEMVSLRGEISREREKNEALRAKSDGTQQELAISTHKQQQAQLALEELRQVKDAECSALRREIEALRQAKDEAMRSSQSQLLSNSQESAKRAHEIELLSQQVSALKHQSEVDARRHKSELDDARRAAEAKLRHTEEETRAAERSARQNEDAMDRLRRQLADERATRDNLEADRDGLHDKIVALQRTVAKRETEIQRLQQQLAHLATDMNDRSKEAEAVQAELDLKQARERKELALSLDQRLKEFRSVSRMRHQTEGMGAENGSLGPLESRFHEVSQGYVDAALDQSHVEQSRAAHQRNDVTPHKPPRAPQFVTTPRNAHTTQDIGVTPIAAAHDASNLALSTMQRVLERQLAAERDRSEELQRKLSETLAGKSMQEQLDRSSAVERSVNRTFNAASAAAQRARSKTAGEPHRVESAATSPRAERLRKVSETLRDLEVRGTSEA